MTRPNILFFHIDNVSLGDFGCYGGGYPIGAKTPNIDAFAGDGFMLTNYNVEAQCSPTRSALMTGRYSYRTGCSSVIGGGIVAWEETIAARLKRLGYRNQILGKWHVGKGDGRRPTDHGFDYWYGIDGTWNEALYPDDKFFQREDLEPSYVVESTQPGEEKRIKVLDMAVRQDIDLEFLDKAEAWMSDSAAADEPFFVYFNHSNMHYPTLPRDEWRDSSSGGLVADCLQMLDADFGRLMDFLDDNGLRDNTIVIVAGDNGRDTTWQAPQNQNAPGPFIGGYFSTYEGNNRTMCVVRWPGHVEPGQSDEMMHVVDWFPTLFNMLDEPDLIPNDRVLDGVDQSDFVTTRHDQSNRNDFFMFFGQRNVGYRYKNFKVLTHRIVDGAAPIEELASPHLYNLTVDPEERAPYDYSNDHVWLPYKVYFPALQAFNASLEGDRVPFGAPVDFNPQSASPKTAS